MKRAIIIHGWDQKPNQEWLPWLANKLKKGGWQVALPQMPNAAMPKLRQWMKTLKTLNPDKNTVLIGHSLACALILKYLECKDNFAKAAFLVAAWDYLLPDLVKQHKTFFEQGFDYEKIKARDIPITIVQSTNDPYLDYDKAKKLADKIGAKFVGIKNAGHFMERDGYKEFPQLYTMIRQL